MVGFGCVSCLDKRMTIRHVYQQKDDNMTKSTDMSPRWGLSASIELFLLQTCRSSGAYQLRLNCSCYRHVAPHGAVNAPLGA